MPGSVVSWNDEITALSDCDKYFVGNTERYLRGLNRYYFSLLFMIIQNPDKSIHFDISILVCFVLK